MYILGNNDAKNYDNVKAEDLKKNLAEGVNLALIQSVRKPEKEASVEQ